MIGCCACWRVGTAETGPARTSRPDGLRSHRTYGQLPGGRTSGAELLRRTRGRCTDPCNPHGGTSRGVASARYERGGTTEENEYSRQFPGPARPPRDANCRRGQALEGAGWRGAARRGYRRHVAPLRALSRSAVAALPCETPRAEVLGLARVSALRALLGLPAPNPGFAFRRPHAYSSAGAARSCAGWRRFEGGSKSMHWFRDETRCCGADEKGRRRSDWRRRSTFRDSLKTWPAVHAAAEPAATQSSARGFRLETQSQETTPLSPGRYKVQFTATQTLHDKLQQLKDLIRHKIPDGELSAIIERAADLLLEQQTKQRFAQTKKSSPTVTPVALPSKPGSRHIPRAVRRAVYARNGGQCTFVSPDGRRCAARGNIEFHHVEPFARASRRWISARGVSHASHASVLSPRHEQTLDVPREAFRSPAMLACSGLA